MLTVYVKADGNALKAAVASECCTHDLSCTTESAGHVSSTIREGLSLYLKVTKGKVSCVIRIKQVTQVYLMPRLCRSIIPCHVLPVHKLVGKAGVMWICSMRLYHTLQLAFEALMDTSQAVWAVECIFGVLQVLVKVQRHVQRVARKWLQLCGRVRWCWLMTFHVTVRCAVVLLLFDATMEGSHAGPITEHDSTCHRMIHIFQHTRLLLETCTLGELQMSYRLCTLFACVQK